MHSCSISSQSDSEAIQVQVGAVGFRDYIGIGVLIEADRVAFFRWFSWEAEGAGG